jgi:hypothetical protein
MRNSTRMRLVEKCAPIAHPRFRAHRLAALAALAVICAADVLRAQAPPQSSQPPAANPAAVAPAQQNAVPGTESKPSPSTPAAPAASAPEPVAPPPDWPINDKPVAATVVWDSHGLRIDADNSSLEQILNDVSTDTGAKVEGLDTDQRVFGTYGPGPARQVLSELLDGTGYNVLMYGDQGEGTPRAIVLSTPPTGPAPANANRNNLATEEDYEPEPPPEPPPAEPASYAPQPATGQPGAPPRTPQQILQQLQQRQQEEMQQNGSGQPFPQQNVPPNNQ